MAPWFQAVGAPVDDMAILRAAYLVVRAGGEMIVVVETYLRIAQHRDFAVAGPIAELIDQHVLIELHLPAHARGRGRRILCERSRRDQQEKCQAYRTFHLSFPI